MMVTEVKVRGNSGRDYTIKGNPTGGLFCSCPAWRFSQAPTNARVCIHINFVRRQHLATSDV